jgi:hypothetical protein
VVCEVAQTGWTQSHPANTNCAAGPAALADGGHAEPDLTSGQSLTGNDFGNFQPPPGPGGGLLPGAEGSPPDTSEVGVKGKAGGPAAEEAKADRGILPFTGLVIGGLLLAGVALFVTGFALRRRAKR